MAGKQVAVGLSLQLNKGAAAQDRLLAPEHHQPPHIFE
jgi:hypothetical protein